MDDAHNNRLAAPSSASRGSWTSRIILSTLACAIGLWLGTGSRTSAAGGQTNGSSAAARTANADVFRFDILLAGKDSRVEPIRPRPAPEKQCKSPVEVLSAMEERPEPIPSALPKTLSCARTRFSITPPARPAAPWRIQLEANLAGVEHLQTELNGMLATVPGMTRADRKSIQVKLDNTCEQVGLIRRQQVIRVPEPPEPLVDLPEPWPERGMQLMP